eukprot:TRINITY_DN7405_c0_g1_i1.p1 TRINITY_DN7405_c0_g1~~TRINITY_DN7405_c0_g1_i1.p1  ORF type:complete len:238 (+),score=46.67 TRINITY_DN7405_c0_g1_i1:1-714(+)
MRRQLLGDQAIRNALITKNRLLEQTVQRLEEQRQLEIHDLHSQLDTRYEDMKKQLERIHANEMSELRNQLRRAQRERDILKEQVDTFHILQSSREDEDEDHLGNDRQGEVNVHVSVQDENHYYENKEQNQNQHHSQEPAITVQCAGADLCATTTTISTTHSNQRVPRVVAQRLTQTPAVGVSSRKSGRATSAQPPSTTSERPVDRPRTTTKPLAPSLSLNNKLKTSSIRNPLPRPPS